MSFYRRYGPFDRTGEYGPIDPPVRDVADSAWCARCEEPHLTAREWVRCAKGEKELAADLAAEQAVDDDQEDA